MTNKSLSQQICEACGIEKEVDFQNNNNNFVKLMELSIPLGLNFCARLLSQITEFNSEWSTKEEFLTILVNVFKQERINSNNFSHYQRNYGLIQFSQQIRNVIKNEEWEV